MMDLGHPALPACMLHPAEYLAQSRRRAHFSRAMVPKAPPERAWGCRVFRHPEGSRVPRSGRLSPCAHSGQGTAVSNRCCLTLRRLLRRLLPRMAGTRRPRNTPPVPPRPRRARRSPGVPDAAAGSSATARHRREALHPGGLRACTTPGGHTEHGHGLPPGELLPEGFSVRFHHTGGKAARCQSAGGTRTGGSSGTGRSFLPGGEIQV